MAEWLNASVLKTDKRETVSWVRILLSPQAPSNLVLFLYICIKLFIMKQPQPSTGKYKFNTFADLSVTTATQDNKFSGVPMYTIAAAPPSKQASYRFNSGDVIDVQQMFFNDKDGAWEAVVSAITEQNRTVPFSILTKVPDNTPITTISRTEKSVVGNYVPIGDTSKNVPLSPIPNDKKPFSQKNIVIGVLVIGAIVGLLKWKKVI
jgi:hypothetical protein